MNRNWMLKTAGVLTLIGGILQVGIGLLISANIGFGLAGGNFGSDESGWAMLFLIAIVPLTVTGVIAIIGGKYALKKKRRAVALVGAILAYIPFAAALLSIAHMNVIISGILLAVILVFTFITIIPMVLSLREFESHRADVSWTLRFAGILDIIIGTLIITGLIILTVEALDYIPFFLSEFFLTSIPFIFPAILAVAGGIYTIRRKKWRLALTGSISALLPFVLWPVLQHFFVWGVSWDSLPVCLFFSLLGIASLIVTLKSRAEFEAVETVSEVKTPAIIS